MCKIRKRPILNGERLPKKWRKSGKSCWKTVAACYCGVHDDALKKEILSGHYKPGDVLNERKLSEDLGISRTP